MWKDNWTDSVRVSQGPQPSFKVCGIYHGFPGHDRPSSHFHPAHGGSDPLQGHRWWQALFWWPAKVPLPTRLPAAVSVGC